MLTAYDYPTARFADEAGIPVLLVGDPLGMVVLGHSTTLPVTLDDIVHHASAVARGSANALLVGDLPFMSYQPSVETAMRSSARLLQEAGMHAVKLEGAGPVLETVHRLTAAGVPVMAHLGLTPQSQAQLGGYRVQGKTLAAVQRLTDDALALQEAGAFAVLLEAVPAEAAAYVRERVELLVYGIGAGPHVDGQLVISHDILGNFVGEIRPRFVRRYADLDLEVERAFRAYAADVRDGRFPAAEHLYPIEPVHEAEIRAARTHSCHPERSEGSSVTRSWLSSKQGKVDPSLASLSQDDTQPFIA